MLLGEPALAALTGPLRSRLSESEGDKRMVWDSQGSSGYQDLVQEWIP
jgi:hypothetical protein